MSPALVRLDSCLSLLTKLLGEAGADLGWAADAAVCRGLNELRTARRLILYSDGRPQQGGLDARRRPEALTVPRADPAPTAATAEEVARVAKKAARNKKKNKARSERRQRKREAKNSEGGEQGGSDVAPPPHMAWTSAPPEPAAQQSEAITQSEPRGALDAHSLAGEEGSNEMQKSTRNGDADGEEKEEQVEFAFNFPLPKRERKPSDEEQVETKRPKSPGKQDEKQEKQLDDVYDTNTQLMMKILETQDKARDKWFAAKETAGPSEQHKGDGSKRE